MLRKSAWVCLVVLVLGAGAAEAETPASPPPATPPAAPAPSGSAAAKPPGNVPTYWVLMVTGEKDGAPWIKTATPETLGGTVKGTEPWTCSYPATERGVDGNTGYEQMELACGVGEAEVFMSLRCSFRTKPKAGKVPGKVWKRSDLQTLNLRRKGDAKSIITVSLRCDVDAAFSVD